jgi:hypothetical protein
VPRWRRSHVYEHPQPAWFIQSIADEGALRPEARPAAKSGGTTRRRAATPILARPGRPTGDTDQLRHRLEGGGWQAGVAKST